MTKRQLEIKMPDSLSKRLNRYAKEKKTLKTNLVIRKLEAQLKQIISKN